jgi:hypothetical protein
MVTAVIMAASAGSVPVMADEAADQAEPIVIQEAIANDENDTLQLTATAEADTTDQENLVGTSSNEMSCSTWQDAVAAIRDGLMNRQDKIVVSFQADDAFYSEVTSAGLSTYNGQLHAWNVIANAVFAHTGVPTEGDYLKSSLIGYSHSLSVLSSVRGFRLILSSISYSSTLDQENALTAKLNVIMPQIIQGKTTPYAKMTAIYSYIVKHVTYDYSHTSNLRYSAYAALINGKAVCNGYAMLLYRMALSSGVDARIVIGQYGSFTHAWNVVGFNGKYYHADACYDTGVSTWSFYLQGTGIKGHTLDAGYANGTYYLAYPISSTNFRPGIDSDAQSGQYTDVTNSAKYYYTPVYWAQSNDVLDDQVSLAFGVDNACTRASTVEFLYQEYGNGEICADAGFSDVSASSSAYNAINWAVAHGVTVGTSAATFSPAQICTRAQVMTFLYKATGQPAYKTASSFSDVAAGAFYLKPVSWAVENGITAGTSATKFSPDATCTRGQIITFLYHAAS